MEQNALSTKHSILPYKARRDRLLTAMRAAGGGIAFIPSALELTRNADNTYPFRADSYFYYLTQFCEPDAALLLIALEGHTESVLFCNVKNQEREIWDGYRFGPEAAATTFGFDHALPIESLNEEMPQWLKQSEQFFFPLHTPNMVRFPLSQWFDTVRSQIRSGAKLPLKHIDVCALIDDMRLHKDALEQDLMRTAACISAGAHIRAMQACRIGMPECALEAELLHEFRRHGADGPAYGSIVGSGANSCILHYRAGDALIKDGDMVLIDAGCEYQGYAGDITRTFPANGRFNQAQKDLYECVLAAQLAAIDAVKVGAKFTHPHDVALRILVQGMFDFGLLQKTRHGNVDQAIEQKHYTRFYMHRTSHWLGLDVHDVGSYVQSVDGQSQARYLAPNMVLTIEPGLYVRPADDIPEAYWNIGIRIEDDILVTDTVPKILSCDAPKTVMQIESTMQH